MSVVHLAEEIMAELDQCRGAPSYATALNRGIMRLAEACNTKLRVPTWYGNGELSIFTAKAPDGDALLPYGEQFAALLQGMKCRTGAVKYGYRAHMMSYNSWCLMPWTEVEAVIQKATQLPSAASP